MALKTKGGGLFSIGEKRKVSAGPLEGKWQEGSDTPGACQLARRPKIYALEAGKGGNAGRRKKCT